MQEDEPEQVEGGTAWLSFRRAAEEVERRRGCSWGKAQKDLLEACEKGKLRWRNSRHGGPDVLDVDLWRWLDPPAKPKPQPKKRTNIKKYLAKKFSGQPVPDEIVRKDLLGELRGCGDPLLKSVDDATLKTAIDEYHADLSTKHR